MYLFLMTRGVGVHKRTLVLILALIVQGTTIAGLQAQAGSETKSFAVQPGDTLALNSDFGKIRIRPSDGASLEIRIQRTANDPSRKGATEVSSRKSGAILFINAIFSGTAGEGVDFDILAPKFINLTISGANPDIDIAGILGVVRIQDSAGRITAENLISMASLATDSGEILFRVNHQPQGEVRLESTSGNITCEIVDNLNLRSTVRAGGKIFWDMDPTVEAASIERQLGTSGPTLYAGSLKGNVVVRLRPGLSPKTAAPSAPTVAASAPAIPNTAPVRESSQIQTPRLPAPAAPAPVLRRETNDGTGAQPAQESSTATRPRAVDPPQPAPQPEGRRTATTKDNTPPVRVAGSYDLKVSVDSVFLNASVRDRSTNRSIPGLQKRDFLIYEDGVLQEIDQLLPTEAPFNLLLLLDVSGSTQSYLHLMKEAAIDFTRQINAQDRVAIATFNSSVQLAQNFTNDRTAAERAINKIRSGGGTAFYDALMTCLDRYMHGIEGRSAIVVFTDGVDNQLEGRPGAGSRTTYDQLYRRVQESDTIIYTIFLDTEGQMQSVQRGPSRMPGGGGWPGGRRRGGFPGSLPFPIPMPGPQPSPTPYPRRQADQTAIYEEASEQLREIAEQTGGRMYTPRKISELSGVYSEIADDLRIQYLLAYNSTNRAQDGRWRQIRVDVENHPEAVARTRRGYYSRKETGE